MNYYEFYNDYYFVCSDPLTSQVLLVLSQYTITIFPTHLVDYVKLYQNSQTTFINMGFIESVTLKCYGR